MTLGILSNDPPLPRDTGSDLDLQSPSFLPSISTLSSPPAGAEEFDVTHNTTSYLQLLKYSLMPPRQCLLCHELLCSSSGIDHGLCCHCHHQFVEARCEKLFRLTYDRPKDNLQMEIPVLAAFGYAPLIRSAVLSVKIQYRISVLDLIARTFLLASFWPSLEPIFTSPHVYLIAAPSSLWGRLHGKCDIAYFLAKHISDHYGISLADTPNHLYWRSRKQAFFSSRYRRSSQIRGKDSERRDQPIFIESQAFDAAVLRSLLELERDGQNCAVPKGADEANFIPTYIVIDDVVTSGETLGRIISSLPYPCRIIGIMFAAAL